MRIFLNNQKQEIDDHTIIKLYKLSQNPEHISPLYKKYRLRLFMFCRGFFGNEDDCYDAVIDIFFLVINELKTKEIRQFEVWLFTIAKHYCLKKKKNLNRLNLISITDIEARANQIVDDQDSFFAKNSKERKQVTLENALKKLPHNQEICLKLFYIEDRTYNEIAEQTDYRLSQVKSYLQNGKRNLKMQLERDNEVINEIL